MAVHLSVSLQEESSGEDEEEEEEEEEEEMEEGEVRRWGGWRREVMGERKERGI